MPEIDQKYIQDKFIEYCKVNTRSDEQSTTVPTTVGQVDLLKIIADCKIKLNTLEK